VERLIQEFVEAKNIAVLGASPRGRKFGNAVYKTLKSKGYNVFPVHPESDTIEGDKAYKGIQSLPDNVDSAVVCIKPDKAMAALKDIKNTGIRRVWFQQGADFSEVQKEISGTGIESVRDRCILMYAAPVTGIHAFHRFIWKLFGKL